MPPQHSRAHAVDLTQVVREGIAVPAMPDDFVLHVFEFKENMQRCGKTASPALDSDTWLKGVHNVPPKPDPTQVRDRHSRAALRASLGGLQNITPVCISDGNIDNHFVVFVQKEWLAHRARNAAAGIKKYLVFVVHINVFDRLIKVRKHTHTTVLCSKYCAK